MIKCVNYIKESFTKSRCFQAFCRDMRSKHQHVLYHAEVRWLSRGKVLCHFYELRAEIAAFLSENKSSLPEHFDCEEWFTHVAYLADRFDLLNSLNVSMQGRWHNRFE